MRRALTILLMVVMIAGSTAALAVDNRTIDLKNVSQQQIDTAVQEYNSQYAGEVPGLVKSIVSGERVNVNISTADGYVVYGAVLDGMTITKAEKGGITHPTLKVYTSTATIKTIADSQNPKKEAIRALKDGRIRYHAVGLIRSIKYGIMTTLLKIFG